MTYITIKDLRQYSAVATDISGSSFFDEAVGTIRNNGTAGRNYFNLTSVQNNSNANVIKNTLGFDYTSSGLPSNFYKVDYNFHITHASDYVIPTINSGQYWFISNLGTPGGWLYSHAGSSWTFNAREPLKSGIDYFKVESQVQYTEEKTAGSSAKYHTFWDVGFSFEILDSNDNQYYNQFVNVPIFEMIMANSSGTSVSNNFTIERLKFQITAFDQDVLASVSQFI